MAFEGRIEEIWAQYNSVRLTIYKVGEAVKRIQIPEGASWELHILTTAAWPEVAPWATAITGKGDVTFGNARRVMGASADYEYAFNMGRMPAADFNVGRIRFWKNMAYSNVPPPEEDR